jgi:hypothetical protein
VFTKRIPEFSTQMRSGKGFHKQDRLFVAVKALLSYPDNVLMPGYETAGDYYAKKSVESGQRERRALVMPTRIMNSGVHVCVVAGLGFRVSMRPRSKDERGSTSIKWGAMEDV